MNTLTQNIIHTTKIVILALILAFGISFIHAAWVGPTASPPGGNVSAPVNVGNVTQVKSGIFVAPEIIATRFTAIDKYCIDPGSCITEWLPQNSCRTIFYDVTTWAQCEPGEYVAGVIARGNYGNNNKWGAGAIRCCSIVE